MQNQIFVIADHIAISIRLIWGSVQHANQKKTVKIMNAIRLKGIRSAKKFVMDWTDQSKVSEEVNITIVRINT